MYIFLNKKITYFVYQAIICNFEINLANRG